MATYIKGVTDTIPNSIPFQANYKMISDTLSNLQQRYNKGFDQVKSMYSSLMNDSLSSSDNEQFRQEYLKKADAQLSKLSGVDFANASNVLQAKGLFRPLVNDTQYVTDLYKTKAQNLELSKMQSVKLSTDQKVHAQYSPIMEEYLMLGKERLSKMKRDDGSIEAAQVHQFTPWQDPIEYASDLAKKQGLSFEKDQINGMYIIHSKNGAQSVGTYKTWYDAAIGDKFDNQYRIEAEVKNERNIRAEMQSNPNLTRDQVIDKLANTFSGRYTELYNNQINDLEGKANEIDRQMRKLMNAYKGKFDPKYAETVNAYTKQKNDINVALAKLKKEKGTDEEFQKKAVDMYKNNPTGVYMSEIKNNYAERFAEKQAYGDTSVEYKPNQVAIVQFQEQQQWARLNATQSFEWQKFVAGKEWDQKKMELQYNMDLEKLRLEGKINGANSGATLGNAEVVGATSSSMVYRETIADTYDKSTKIYKNENVLAVAAGLSSNIKNHSLTQDQNDVNISVVSQAIDNKFKGVPLTQPQLTQLTKYLALVHPGYKYNDSKDDTQSIVGIIQGGFKFHKTEADQLGGDLVSAFSEARQSFSNLNKLQYDSQLQLENQWNTRADYRSNQYIIKKIGKNGIPTYAINYDKVDKLDEADRESIYANLIPSYSGYKDKSDATRSTVVLNPPDPNKFDQTIHSNAIQNAEFFGITNAEGKFEKFDDEDLAKFKTVVTGGDIMKQTLDPTNTTYALKVVGGNKYVKVTIPVKKNEKGESMATVQSLPNSSDIEESNKIEFYVPLNKATTLGGNDVLYTNPSTGATSTVPNDLKRQIYKMVEKPLIEEQPSWVTTGGLATKGETALPMVYNSVIDGGKIFRGTDDSIKMEFYSDGKMRTMDLTKLMNSHISYSEYKNNPTKYDDEIQRYVEDYMTNVDRLTVQNGAGVVNTNKVAAANNSDWIDWKTIKYSFGHN
jgi:hypothetical protein